MLRADVPAGKVFLRGSKVAGPRPDPGSGGNEAAGQPKRDLGRSRGAVVSRGCT